MTPAALFPFGIALSVFLSSCWATPAQSQTFPAFPLNGPQLTTVLVRVVAHGGMVLGRDVGGARVTITDIGTGRILATGLQQGDPGDQNQIMRTPRMIGEPIYSSRPSAAFTATLDLQQPTVVAVSAEGPLAYPAALQKTSTTLLLIPGQNLTHDGIVLHLYGYLVEIDQPKPQYALIAKDDVTLRASVRTLSGSLVRPHGDWDSRKVRIYGEILIGDRTVERLQLFYDDASRTFQAPFFVPLPTDAPDGITLRVVAADQTGGNFGVSHATFAIRQERLPEKTR
jgi:hypothetical protein